MFKSSPVLRVSLYLVLWLVLADGCGSLLVRSLLGGQVLEGAVYARAVLIGELAQALVILVVTAFCRYFLDQTDVVSLGYGGTPAAVVLDLLAGLLIGTIAMAAIGAVEVSQGWLRISGITPGALAPLVRSIAIFALVAYSEETIFRGYVLTNLEQAWGQTWAFVVSSGLFGLMHLLTDNANTTPPLLVLLGLTLAGFVQASAYYVRRTIWLPMGLHFAWNFAQVAFGVDGSKAIGQSTLLAGAVQGPALVVGTDFGPEVGLLGWLGMLLMLLLLHLYTVWQGEAA